MSITGNMFEAIQQSFNKKSNFGGGQYKDILRLEKDNDYTVRLLPFEDDLSQTIFQLKYHGWKSVSTGKYMEFMSPVMVDKPDPITSYSYDLGDKLRALKLDAEDPRMKKARKLWTKDGWLVNCYVVNDPVNEENNGTVKVLRVGKQLHDIIDEHLSGRRSKDFGKRIFDLNSTGCDFVICVGSNEGGYKSYLKSYFSPPSEIKGISENEDKIQEIWKSAFRLSDIFPIKSYDQLKEILHVHYLGDGESLKDSETDVTDNDSFHDELKSEDPIMGVNETNPVVETITSSGGVADEELDKIMNDLQV